MSKLHEAATAYPLPSPRLDRPLLVVGAGAAARLTGIAAGIATGLVTTALAYRLLGVSSYGLLALALSTMVLVASLARMGLEAGTTRWVASLAAAPHKPATAGPIRGVYSLTFLTGIVGAAVLMVLLLAVENGSTSGTRWALSVGAGLLLFGSNYVAATFSAARGLSRVIVAEVPYLLLGLAKLGVVIAAWLLGVADVRFVAVGYGAAGIASALASLVIGRTALSIPTRSFLPSLSLGLRTIPLFLPYAIASFATYALSRLDVVALGVVEGTRAVGTYEPALKVIEQMMLLVPFLVGAQFLSVATGLFVQERSEELGRLYEQVTKIGYAVGMGAVLILLGFPEKILAVLYGRSFHVPYAVVVILVCGFFINLLCGPNLGMLLGSGHRGPLVGAYLSTLGVVIAAVAILVPWLGMEGAALATAVGYLALNIAVSTAVWQLARSSPFTRSYLRMVATSAIPLLSVLQLHGWFAERSLWIAAGVTAAIWASWIGLLLATGELRLPRLLHRGPSADRLRE